MNDINVLVRGFADFRSLVGAQTKVELSSGRTLRDLLEILFKNHDGLRKRVFDPEGQLSDGTHIIMNGHNIVNTKDLETKLKDGDQVYFCSALSGG